MKRLLVMLGVILCYFTVTGQKITGRIVDEKTGKPISSVEISNESDSVLTHSNFLGFFEILVDRQSQIVASHIAYHDVSLQVGDKEKIVFSMQPFVKELPQLNLIGFSEEKSYDIDSVGLTEYGDYYIEGSDTIYVQNYSAQFPGGNKGLYNYLGRNFRYDSTKYRSGHALVVNFTIDKTGVVQNVFVSGDTLEGAGQLIKKTFLEMPVWKPAKQAGANTSQSFTVEIFYGAEVFLVVEQSAQFPGGMNAFYEYAEKKLRGKYPDPPGGKSAQNKVFINFVIERDGSIDPQNVSVMQGIGGVYDELAIMVVKESPLWIPANTHGKPVRQRLVLPIFFR